MADKGKSKVNGEGNITAPAAAAAAPPATQQAAPSITPELAAQIGQLRSKIQLSIGQVILAVMDLPRYKHLSLGDLPQLIISPLLRNRVAIAHKSVTKDGTTKVDEETIAGIAIWATVSPAVDAKITEQIKAGVFPVRLAAEDWTSGDLPWLLDVIAADRQAATTVLANFRQVAGDKQIRIHPMVGRLIDPAVLEKLKLASVEGKAKPQQAPMGEVRGNA